MPCLTVKTSVYASQQDDLFGSQDAKCTKPLACKPATTKMMARAQACSDLQLHWNGDRSNNSDRSLLIFSFVIFFQTKSSTVAICTWWTPGREVCSSRVSRQSSPGDCTMWLKEEFDVWFRIFVIHVCYFQNSMKIWVLKLFNPHPVTKVDHIPSSSPHRPSTIHLFELTAKLRISVPWALSEDSNDSAWGISGS